MPVSPPLTVKESDGSVSVRPTNVLSFNAADFTVSGSGDTATISIDSTGTGAALTAKYVGFGNASNLLTGSADLQWDDTAKELTVVGDSDNDAVVLIKGGETAAGQGPKLEIRNTAGTDSFVKLFTDNYNVTYMDGGVPGGTTRNIWKSGQLSADTFITTFNNDALPADFQIKGDTEDNLFYADGGNDNIGIGGVPNSGIERLEVIGAGSSNPMMRLRSTESGATSSPVFSLYRNRTGANNDDAGSIRFEWDNDADEKVIGAEIYSEIQTATDGSESNRLRFYNMFSGSSKEWLRVSNNTIEVNAFSESINLKIEGDTAAHVNFYAYASQDNVGIGTIPDSDVERLHILGDGVTDDIVRIQTDDDGAASGPHVQWYRNSATPQDGDDLGEIFFAGNHAATSGGSSAGKQNYARIRSESPEVESSAECGRLVFDVSTNGSLIEFARMTASGASGYIVFNESSNNIDFRVESNNNGNMFKVDAGIDRVSIGAVATSGGATFQVPNGTMSSYCHLSPVRADATAQQNMTNDDLQGQTWVNDSSTAWTILLPESGLKGQWCDILSTDGNWTVTCQTGDTLNGVAGSTSVSRNTNYAIYRIICITNNTWVINNPE